MHNTSGERHFKSLDFGKISVFSSAFPVDSSDPMIRKITQKKLPETLDDIFFLNGSSETKETTKDKGALPLIPESAYLDIQRNSSDAERKIIRGHSYIFSSLTDDSPLTAAHLQLDIESGAVRSFSVTSRNMERGNSPIYELRGYLDEDAEEGSESDSVFEVTKYSDDKLEWSHLVDEEMATYFAHALEERRTCRLSEGNLPSLLLGLADASKDITRTQVGNYRVRGHDSLALSVERTQRIQKGIVRAAAWSLVMKEVHAIDSDITATRTFSLWYDNAHSPHYKTQLDYLVNDELERTTHKERESDYEEMSMMFRNNPSVLFAALADAAAKLQEISFDT